MFKALNLYNQDLFDGITMMRYRNRILCLAVCCSMLGVGCGDDQTGAQTQENIKQSKQEPDNRENDAKRVAELGRQATEAFSSGDYGLALEKSAKICELEPDNISNLMLRGSVSFAAGKMAECISAYDEAIRVRPSIEPQLWQRGLALYYADRFDAGVKQFETHQTVNSQDVENAVWHLLCAARVSDLDKAREKLIPITGDTRVPMSQIYEMFAGRMTPEDVLARAKATTETEKTGSQQQQLQLYYAYLYTGLYHEMLEDTAAAQASLRKAAEVCPLGKTNFMGQVARVHLMLRDKAN